MRAILIALRISCSISMCRKSWRRNKVWPWLSTIINLEILSAHQLHKLASFISLLDTNKKNQFYPCVPKSKLSHFICQQALSNSLRYIWNITGTALLHALKKRWILYKSKSRMGLNILYLSTIPIQLMRRWSTSIYRHLYPKSNKSSLKNSHRSLCILKFLRLWKSL